MMKVESDLRIESPKQAYCNPSEITVKAEYKSMLPRPTEKEYEQIKESIKTDGQDKPVEVDQNMVLVDGHTRLEICIELKKQVFYEQRIFKDRSEVLRHMAIANLHRRNLNQYQKVILYHELYEEEKKKAKERRVEARKISSVTVHNIYASKAPTDRGIGGEALKEKPEIKIEDQGRARKAYADLIGVSEVAVMQTTFIKDHGGAVINKAVKDGKMKVREAYWKTKERLQLKKPVENVKQYIFTIQPEEGSQWTCHRKLKPSQIPAIKQYIEKMPVRKK